MSNDLIVVGAGNNAVAQAVAADLFKDIDFGGISKAIEKIAQSNGQLSTEEKEMANGIVDQWQSDVIDRLRDKGGEMNAFVNFFSVGTDGFFKGKDLFEEIGEDLAQKTNTVTQYEALVTLFEELQDIHDNRPEQPKNQLDIDKTQKEILEEENKYKLESAKYQFAESKKRREIYLAEKEWKKLLQQNSEVKDLLKKAKKFNKDMTKFTQLCHDKAQLAKLNITVSDANVRDALKDLLDFSTNEL